MPFNRADASGFCKGAHPCGNGVNRNLTFRTKTKKNHETQQVISGRINFFSSENCQRDSQVFLED